MATAYSKIEAQLRNSPRTWLITGVAGFIGSHLAERLLSLGQDVVGVDNFVTGSEANLAEIRRRAGRFEEKFRFTRCDINDTAHLEDLIPGADTLVLHQAALGSVPRSIVDPLATHRANVDGFVSVLQAARECGVRRFVYASSSSVYGDQSGLPKQEERIGNQLSPYALSKYCNELYAQQFSQHYGLECIGLRYFNVFGPRQDPNGAYAAVIPRWFSELRSGHPGTINGDGQTSRDFCYVENAVQANILAACTQNPAALNQVFNIACGDQMTLLELYEQIYHSLKQLGALPEQVPQKPLFVDFRAGDIRHSLASIQKAQDLLGYAVAVRAREGIAELAKSLVSLV